MMNDKSKERIINHTTEGKWGDGRGMLESKHQGDLAIFFFLQSQDLSPRIGRLQTSGDFQSNTTRDVFQKSRVLRTWGRHA